MKPVDKARAIHTVATLQKIFSKERPEDIPACLIVSAKDYDYLVDQLPNATRGKSSFLREYKIIANALKNQPEIKKTIDDAYHRGPNSIWVAMEGEKIKQPNECAIKIANVMDLIHILMLKLKAREIDFEISKRTSLNNLTLPIDWEFEETDRIYEAINDLKIFRKPENHILGINSEKLIYIVFEQLIYHISRRFPSEHHWIMSHIKEEVMPKFNSKDKLNIAILRIINENKNNSKPGGIVSKHREEIINLRAEGMSYAKIGKQFSVSGYAISKGIKKL